MMQEKTFLSKIYNVELKNYSRVMCHDNEGWYKIFKNDVRNLVNFSESSGNSENLHFDGLRNVWAKNIQRRCVRKNDLWLQKWHKEFGEFLHKYLKVMLDKSSLYNVFAEGIYFLDKSGPSNFNFLDFPLLVCPVSSCDFWNQKSVFV